MDRGEVLVAIMNNKHDWNIVRKQHWYRIPVSSAKKWLKDRWPPKWLAFYHTKVFGNEAHAVKYYAPVLEIRNVKRLEILPDTPRNHPKANRRYYQLLLGPLQSLPAPIFSRRYRRLVFLPTTWKKFQSAVEINDLWDESPLEDKLWALFKRFDIRAERQYPLEIEGNHYFLDFAIFCKKANLDVETDGDFWHSQRERIAADNRRDNALEALGWHVLRFNTEEIRDAAVEYCVSKVMKAVGSLGGFDDRLSASPSFDPDDPTGPRQLGLFD